MLKKIDDEYFLNSFFTSNGRVNQQRIKHATDEEKEYLKNRYNDSFSFRKTLIRIKYKIDIHPVCQICGNDVAFRGKINGIYSTYCSKKCFKIGMPKNVEHTNLKRYGVKHTSQLDSVKEKSRQTSLNKYGTESPKQSEIVKNKYKTTCLERYEVKNVFQNEDIKNKYKKTCLERYGVENISQVPAIQEKIKHNNLEKYGVSSTSKLDSVKEKIRQTCLEKYGTTSYTKTDEFKHFYMKIKKKSYNINMKLKNYIIHSLHQNQKINVMSY